MTSQAPILIIQPAFIGDVVLATSLIEPLREVYPDHPIHILVREGNEDLISHDPRIEKIWIWKKKQFKYWKLFQLRQKMKKTCFSLILNLHRHISSAYIASGLKAKSLRGFKENPLSLIYSYIIPHASNGLHEIDKLLELLPEYQKNNAERPVLFEGTQDLIAIKELGLPENYICIAPGSVWKTKQLPTHKWKEVLSWLGKENFIILLGGKDAQDIALELSRGESHILNFCGQLSLLQSYLLIKGAKLFIGNDSAPLHFASAANTPSQAIFLSTVPEFGYGPRAAKQAVAEVKSLSCRPCGSHGKESCPLGHFQCAEGLKQKDFELL